MSPNTASFGPIKRRSLLGLAAALCAAAAGCSAGRAAGAGAASAQDGTVAAALRRFEGLGVELVVDAVPGAELSWVEFIDDRGVTIYTSATVAQRNREIMALGGARVPLTVRVRWHEPDKRWDPVSRRWSKGTVLGDHVVAVASRIPAEVTDSLRAERGLLRLKFRLSHDGVHFGWDIERRPGYDPNRRDEYGRPYYAPPVYSMTGGDFVEARVKKVGSTLTKDKGWYIDKKTGQRIETDY